MKSTASLQKLAILTIGVIILSVISNPVQGGSWRDDIPTWIPGPSFSTARAHHTLTVVDSGLVLMAGGYNANDGALSSCNLYSPAASVWRTADELATARYQHTATLLPGGGVVVAGGRNSLDGPLGSVEVFDSKAELWSPAASLNQARYGHTATLLATGEVLVVAGTDGFPLATCEIYDPEDDNWRLVGSLAVGRHGHTATLLPSGEVLVTGGLDGSDTPLASVEVFDPSTETWSAGTAMVDARANHTSTLMHDGNVLVAGGDGASAILNTTEIFSPSTGLWSDGPSLIIEGMTSHEAVLLQTGYVFLMFGRTQNGISGECSEVNAGGWGDGQGIDEGFDASAAVVLPSGHVLVAGGMDDENYLGTSVIYFQYPFVWAGTVSNPTAVARREGHSATVLTSGDLLLVGGIDDLGSFTDSCEVYEPDTDAWRPAASPLAAARAAHTATLLPSGHVLVAGGADDSGVLASCEVFDTVTEAWTATGGLVTARRNHTATLLPSGRVVVTGGEDSGGTSLEAVEIFDPVTGIWSEISPMSDARAHHTATLLTSGDVLVAGGASSSGGTRETAEVLDPLLLTWRFTAPMSDARHSHTASLLATGEVLVVAGQGLVTGLERCELYDPQLERWIPVSELDGRIADHSATVSPTGDVFVVGGIGIDENRNYMFLPSTGQWAWLSVTHAGSEYFDHVGARLMSDELVVVGGSGDEYSSHVYPRELVEFTARPRVVAAPNTIRFGEPFELVVARARGVSEAHGGTTSSGSTDAPIVQLQSMQSGFIAHLAPSAAPCSFFETMEGGIGCWSERGLWHLVEDSTCATPGFSSPTRAVYFGRDDTCMYDTGSATSGELVSLPIGNLDSESLLSFDYFRDVDPSGGSTDITRVEISEVGSSTWDQVWELTSDDPSSPSWIQDETIALGGYAGQEIQVRFAFDSIDAVNNGFTGWMLDDISIDGSSQCTGWFGTSTLRIEEMPSTLQAGWYELTVLSAGLPSPAQPVWLECSIAITDEPEDVVDAEIGVPAEFAVSTQGASKHRWQRCTTELCEELDWIDIPGAGGSSFSTAPVNAADSGTRYRVAVSNGCTTAVSAPALLQVADSEPPTVEVIAPSGGEYWLLSDPGSPAETEVVSWQMADNVRICNVEVSLWYSSDGGVTWQVEDYGDLPGDPEDDLPAEFGPGGTCVHPGEVTSSLVYRVPEVPPARTSGALYRIRVTATDHAGLVSVAESDSPFYIVRPNPDSVRTLILSHSDRLGALTSGDTSALATKLYELADHPRVQGQVVDLGAVSGLDDPYLAWDVSPGDHVAANAVVTAIHEYLLDEVFPVYSGVEHLVLVGDDRIVPFARITDGAVLHPEPSYPAGDDMTADGSTVGQALAAGFYLSDDPLAVMDSFSAGELESVMVIPDLKIGRLVETPAEIVTTIATFISQDGVLDLSLLDPESGHKSLITGYDFLVDTASIVRSRWKNAFDVTTPPSSTSPVDGALVGGTWGLPSVGDRVAALREHFSGNGGATYGVTSINGHASHYQMGVPGADPFDIQGLDAIDVYGEDDCGGVGLDSIDLSGSVVYGIGCHSGLTVPGSCQTDADHSLDLPQTMMARGAIAFLANTGYGWGLRFGVGYAERLVEIFTEELTRGGTLEVGELARKAKLRYYLEAPRMDAYDEKTLMQWTLFGLPMYSIRTGIDVGKSATAESTVRIEETVVRSGLPSWVTRLDLHFDLSADGIYVKRNSLGEVLGAGDGCPDPEGCYYTLNNLVERGTGSGDLPIQPFLIFDSRLSGTSQHGVLWTGGTYDEESGWIPVIAELASNGGDGTNHGDLPRIAKGRPTGTRVLGGDDPDDCRPTDLELNGLVVPTGEAVRRQTSALDFTIERIFREIDLEIIYYNNTIDGDGNCDRQGPIFGDGPFEGDYHQVSENSVSWSVPASDSADVWRVVVVTNDGLVDVSGQGRWRPVELEYQPGSGVWTGQADVTGLSRLTYVVEAVDSHGNVTWLDWVTDNPPSSGVELDIPLTVDVETSPLFSDGFESGDTGAWQ